jgi:hypothetical protein
LALSQAKDTNQALASGVIVGSFLSLGRAADLAVYATAASHLRRIFETLGIDRKARDCGNIIDSGAVELWSPLRQSLREAIAREKQVEAIDE